MAKEKDVVKAEVFLRSETAALRNDMLPLKQTVENKTVEIGGAIIMSLKGKIPPEKKYRQWKIT
jgi:hypothetical protein